MFFCILFSPSGCDNSGSAEMTAEQLQKQQTHTWMQMTTVSSFSVLLYSLSISNCILYFSQGMRRQWISGDDGGATTEAADTYMDADDNSKQCFCVLSSNALSLLSLIPILLIDMHLLFKDTSFFMFFCILYSPRRCDNSGSAEMTTEQLQMQQTHTWMQMTTVSIVCAVLSSNALSLLSLIPISLIDMHLLFKDTLLIHVFLYSFFSQWMRQQWISGDDDRATTDAADTSMDADDNSKQFTLSFTLYYFYPFLFCIRLFIFHRGCDDSGSAEMTAEQLQKQQTHTWMQMTTVSSVCVYSLATHISLLSLIPILLIDMHLLFKDTSLIYVFLYSFFSQWMRQQWISGDDDGATTDAADTSMDADDNSKQFFSFTLFFIHF